MREKEGVYMHTVNVRVIKRGKTERGGGDRERVRDAHTIFYVHVHVPQWPASQGWLAALVSAVAPCTAGTTVQCTCTCVYTMYMYMCIYSVHACTCIHGLHM